MIGLIAQKGPKIDEIARTIGVHSETVRYWYRQLLNRGFTIEACCNYERLGMKRLIVVIEFGDSYKDHASSLLHVMGENAFIVGFAKTQLQGPYLLNISIPQGCLDSWTDFMIAMKRNGIFKSLESVEFDWVRDIPMWATHFNFDTVSWEFDWNSQESNPAALDVKPVQKEIYDSIDLKILEYLQTDASRSLSGMSENSEANYKTFSWHHREHVSARGLVKSYRVNWIGAQHSPTNGRRILKRQGNLWVDIVAKDITKSERLDLMMILNRTPFVWAEGSGSRTYFARMVFPTDETPDALHFLEMAVSAVKDRTKWFLLNQTNSMPFSLPWRNFDEGTQAWTFDGQGLSQELARLVRKIGKGIA